MSLEYTETVFHVNGHYTKLDIPLARSVPDYTGMEFTANLRRHRVAKGWNQEDLAERLGVAQPTVQRWENGKREPKFADIERLASELGVAVADLFADGEGEPIPNAEQLATMIERAMREMEVGVSFEDYPSAVASSLHEQLRLYRVAGGFGKTDAGSAPGRGAQSPVPTSPNAPEEPRTP